jgi:hypothetical protein
MKIKAADMVMLFVCHTLSCATAASTAEILDMLADSKLRIGCT